MAPTVIFRRMVEMLVILTGGMSSFVARAEKANVFFIHGANVSEQDGRVWAAENKGLLQG